MHCISESIEKVIGDLEIVEKDMEIMKNNRTLASVKGEKGKKKDTVTTESTRRGVAMISTGISLQVGLCRAEEEIVVSVEVAMSAEIVPTTDY